MPSRVNSSSGSRKNNGSSRSFDASKSPYYSKPFGESGSLSRNHSSNGFSSSGNGAQNLSAVNEDASLAYTENSDGPLAGLSTLQMEFEADNMFDSFRPLFELPMQSTAKDKQDAAEAEAAAAADGDDDSIRKAGGGNRYQKPIKLEVLQSVDLVF